MMLTLVTPVYAEAIEGQTTIRLKIRPQQGEWKYIEKAYNGRDNSTYYAVELYAETDEETFKLSGAQFYLNFDKEVLEFRTLTSTGDDSIKYDEADNENALNVTQPTPSECNSKGYVPLILYCNANHVLKSGITLVTAVFTVKQNTESGIANFTLDTPKDEEKETLCSFNVTENGGPVVTSHTVDDSATATVTINGKAPTLDSVTLSAANNTVTVQGGDAAATTVQATATSTSNKDITSLVAWSISGDEDSGVSINAETGAITVDAKAKAGDYTVTATAKTGESQGENKTATLKVTRMTPSYKITVTPASKDMIIPTSGEITQQFTAVAEDQYGDKVTTGFTWSLSDTVSGVSIDSNGLVTVTAEAKDKITTSETFSVIATLGNTPGGGVRGLATLVVKRNSTRVPSSIVISGTVSTLAVPETGEQNATATYTAKVYDQYGDVMTEHDAINWELKNERESDAFSQAGVTIENGVVTVTKVAAENDFVESEDSAKAGTLLRTIWVKATCEGVSGGTLLTLTRQPATVTRLEITGKDTLEVPTKSDNEGEKYEGYSATVYDQYGVEMDSSNLTIEREKPADVKGVEFKSGGITVTSDAAKNTFKDGECQFSITFTYNENGKQPVTDTKTITLTRQPSEATSFDLDEGGSNSRQAVPHEAGTQVPASVKVTVRDQYGLKMTDAEVQPDGTLPTGIVLKDGKLYITKDAVDHFDNERGDSTKGIRVSLKSGNAEVTVTVHLKLAAAQTSRDSAEITGQANIARPTGDTPNTAGYTIGDIVDQYGLPLTFDPTKLTMTLEDKEDESGFSVKDGPVTLSGPVDGKWTITVTSGAVVNTKYYLKAKYSDMRCAPVMKITITDKAVSATPLPVVQGDITYGETVNPSVSNKPAGAGAITYTYVGRGGTTYNSSDAPTNAGKYTVTATCEDATHIYTGSVDFQILPKEIKVDWIELTNDEYTYNGQQQTVKYTVKDKDINKLLKEGTDYTVKDNSDSGTNAGPYLLEITGKGNYYSDPDATVPTSVTWNIWALPVKINTATFKPRGYAKDDYSAALDTLTLVADKDGVVMPDNLTEGNGFTVSDIRVTNNNVGQQPVSFKVTLNNTNYKWAAPETGNTLVAEGDNFKVEITKADHDSENVSAEGKYGNQLSVDLSQYLEGGSATVDTIADDKNILAAVEGGVKAIVQNGKLWLQLTDNSAKVGKSAQVTLTVSSTNYNDFTVTVTVTVQAKETQVITASGLNVTYGDAGVKLNASALDNAQLTYEVTEGDNVIAVDENGNVTLKKSGAAKIKITAEETANYGTANITVTVTVAKRSLTVKANDLTAYVGGQLPALDYTVTGLVSGETLTTVPELELKDVPAGVDPMKTAGTYTIGFKTAPTADADKYDLTVLPGTLTVSSRPNVNPVPAGNSVKLEEAEGGKLTSSVSRATKGTTVTITVKPDEGYRLEELEVLDKNGESLPLKELANGKFSFEMPNSRVTVQATFAQESTYAGYPDVLPQDWFYSAVRYVTERGLMNGTPNGFEPNMDSSRATIWTILARFSGVDTTVVSGEWYAVARQWAMENGVSDGTNPNGIITREQLATMLYRYAQTKGLVKAEAAADLSVFVDADQISTYALDAMRWAVSVGLLNGMDGNRLAPQGSAARAQVATMLMRFDQLAK